MKTHLLIPARLNATRLPRKPLLSIHGKPMVVWTASRAKQAVAQGVADDFWVATDDESIASVCAAHGLPYVMTSPTHATGTDRLGEAATILGFDDHDIVLNLQGDEPLLPSTLLAQTKHLLFSKPECMMATLCEPLGSMEDFLRPSVVKVVMANQAALYFSRAPIPHAKQGTSLGQAYRHLGVYGYRVGLLKRFGAWSQGVLEQLEGLEQLRVLEQGAKIAIDIAKLALPNGVDTQEDLDKLNALTPAQWQGYLDL